MSSSIFVDELKSELRPTQDNIAPDFGSITCSMRSFIAFKKGLAHLDILEHL